MLTFRELLELVPVADKRENVVSAKSLLESNIPIVAREMLGEVLHDPELVITVYANGYVVYQNKTHRTFFPLHSCGEYVYDSAYSDSNIVNKIGRDTFDNENWYIRLILEGEDRLVHNYESRVGKREVSYSAVAEDWSLLGYEERLYEPPVREKSYEEVIEELIDLLTENQFYVVHRFCLEKVGQKELAEELGISVQAVSDTIQKARRRIKNAYDVTLVKRGRR